MFQDVCNYICHTVDINVVFWPEWAHYMICYYFVCTQEYFQERLPPKPPIPTRVHHPTVGEEGEVTRVPLSCTTLVLHTLILNSFTCSWVTVTYCLLRRPRFINNPRCTILYLSMIYCPIIGQLHTYVKYQSSDTLMKRLLIVLSISCSRFRYMKQGKYLFMGVDDFCWKWVMLKTSVILSLKTFQYLKCLTSLYDVLALWVYNNQICIHVCGFDSTVWLLMLSLSLFRGWKAKRFYLLRY